MRAVLSPDAVTMRVPSALKTAEFTQPSWPRRTAISLAVAAFQMRAVLSADAVTMRVPSGLKAAEFKQWSWLRRTDRKSVVEGKRVEVGCPGVLKKKNPPARQTAGDTKREWRRR